MTSHALALERQAGRLPSTERERSAERLLAQMHDERLTAVDEAWVAEAENVVRHGYARRRRQFLQRKPGTSLPFACFSAGCPAILPPL